MGRYERTGFALTNFRSCPPTPLKVTWTPCYVLTEKSSARMNMTRHYHASFSDNFPKKNHTTIQ